MFGSRTWKKMYDYINMYPKLRGPEWNIRPDFQKSYIVPALKDVFVGCMLHFFVAV